MYQEEYGENYDNMSFQHIPPDTFSIVSTYASYIFL